MLRGKPDLAEVLMPQAEGKVLEEVLHNDEGIALLAEVLGLKVSHQDMVSLGHDSTAR